MITELASVARPDLPLGRNATARLLPWIIGAMAYLFATGGIALVFIGDAIGNWDRALGGTLTLQLPAETSGARLQSALAALRQTRGVLSAEPLDQAATASLLKPWLGDSVPVDVLPLPRLVDVRIDPDAGIDFAALQQHLASIAPGARLDDHRVWLARLHRFARRVESLIVGVLVASGALMVLSVVFTTGTGFALHQRAVELLHLLGAADSYIARQFQLEAARLGLFGGLGGAALAAITLAVAAGAIQALELPQPAPVSIGNWRVWVVLGVTVLGAAVVAMATVRVAVLRRLAALP